jgi:hypothetical protein
MGISQLLHRFRKYLRKLSWRRAFLIATCIYWVLSIISFFANRYWIDHLRNTTNLQETCYRTDALLIYVECNGFFGASLAEFVLGLYWLKLQMMLAVIGGIKEYPNLGGIDGVILMWFATLMVVVLFLPLGYPFWYVLTRKSDDKSKTL